MSPPLDHSKQLTAARRAYQRQRRAQAIARVRAYQRWLRTGSDLRQIPEIPTDNDYRTFRETQRHP